MKVNCKKKKKINCGGNMRKLVLKLFIQVGPKNYN
jgi:hypothetical protein